MDRYASNNLEYENVIAGIAAVKTFLLLLHMIMLFIITTLNYIPPPLYVYNAPSLEQWNG